MTFGERLKDLREARGVSRRDLAVRVHISEAYLEKVERGYSAPPAALTISDLTRALNADADELFALSGKMAPELERAVCASPVLAQVLRLASKWDGATLEAFLVAQGVVPSRCVDVVSVKNDERRVQRGAITAEIKRAVFHLDSNECVYCSNVTLLEVDHIQPVSLGGTNDLDNLVTCCARCNKKKGNGKPFVRVFGRFAKEVV